MDDKLARAKAILEEKKASQEASELIEDVLAHVDNGLTNYYVPDTVRQISANAFVSAVSIEKIFVSASVKVFPIAAIRDLPNLKAVFVSDKNENFAGVDGCLYSKNADTLIYFRKQAKAVIPPTVKSIGDYAFFGSQSHSLVIPDTVTSLGEHCFSQAAFQVILIGKGIQAIPPHCCEGSNELAEIRGMENVKEIGEYAFSGCVSLEKLPLPKNLQRLGGYAYRGIEKVDHILLPPQVEVAPYALSGITGLLSLTLSAATSCLPKGLCRDCIKLNEVNLENVQVIGDEAFMNCYQLGVSSFDGVKRIGAEAFANNKKIVHLNLPSSLESMGEKPFLGMMAVATLTTPFLGETQESEYQGLDYLFGQIPNSLIKVELIDGIKKLPKGAFEGARYLIEVILPSSLEYVEWLALQGLVSIQRLTVPFLGATVNETTSLKHFFGAVPLSLYHVTVLNGITAIPAECFKDMFNIVTVTLPLSVKEIGKKAFMGCRSLERIRIPLRSEARIAKNALKGCPLLKKDFPPTVKY